MALHNDVFNLQIWQWFCDDLDSCLLVSKEVQAERGSFKGGTNFPACLTIFSVIEMATGYFVGKEPSTDAVVSFLGRYFSSCYAKFASPDFDRSFYDVFRHGLAHQWSPKAAAISMDFNRSELLLSWNELPCLNVPVFFEHTKAALRDYENDLDNTQDLRDRFKKRFDTVLRRDYARMDKLKELLSDQDES